MNLSFCAAFWTLLVLLLYSSCIIFTLAMAEINNLEGSILGGHSNSTIDLVENKTLTEDIVTPAMVAPLVDVIHGNVNSNNHVIPDIQDSIDEFPIFVKTEIIPDENLSSSIHLNTTTTPLSEPTLPLEQRLVEEVVNLTAPEVPPPGPQQNATTGGSQDDIPSFSEWAKKHMAEAGRPKGENLTVGSGGGKLRSKNYASPDCGAKVIMSNPEAGSPSAILSSSRDDYMLNACNVKIWFIVELCEPIQPLKIEIANFELFSSSPQELSIYTSDRYPSREWAQAGALTAKDERTIQSFPLPRISHFVKYIKVELHSHYGNEHFCPISLFRAYGTSELEVLETVDSEEPVLDDEEDEEVVGEKRDLLEELENASLSKEEVKDPPSSSPEQNQGEKTNIFGSAKAAVLSIVKKATEVLGKTSGNQTSACGQGGLLENSPCFTPGYQIVCSNCSDNFYSRLYNLVCCHGTELQCLLANPFVNSVISESQLCNEIGLNWTDTEPVAISNNLTTIYSPKVEYIKAFLPREMIAALCNYLAVSKRTVVLNTTHEQFIDEGGDKVENLTTNIKSNDEPNDLKENETQIIQPTKVVPEETIISPEKEIQETSVVTEPTAVLEEPHINTTVAPTLPTQTVMNETVDKAISQEEPNITQQLVMETNGDESVTIDSLALDSLFPETEEVYIPSKVKPEDTGEQEETKAPVTVQKESVFVRQANRIKALEVNMSLSSQYLEELSRRYKKQVEELQRNLNSVLEDRRLASEREVIQGAQLTALANKVEVLSLKLGELIDERDSWSNKLLIYGQHGIIVLFEVIGFIVLVWVWRTLGSNQTQCSNEKQQNLVLVRRHSAEEPCKRNTVRRPSEEACLPSGRTHKELLTEAPRRKVSRDGMRKRKRRRKGGDVVVIGSGESDWQPLQPAPEFMKTAMWQRGKRSSQTQTSSSQEALSISSETSKPKKPGAFRRIVKKLF